MSNRSLIILSVLLALILLVSLAIIASMAQDGDGSATQAPVSSLEPVIFRDAVMSIDDDVTYDVRFSGGVVQAYDYEHSLPLEWDAGFIADIEGEQYVVCPHGRMQDADWWWGYVVPTSDTETIHCENDPEPPRITTVPSEN